MSILPYKNNKQLFSSGMLYAVILAAVIFVSIFYFSQNFLEPKAYDFMTKLTANRRASENIVNVVIDDESISKIGRWPWRRTYYTDMFDYFENQAHARVIAFDALITSFGDEKDDKDFFKRVNKFDKVVIGLLFNKKADKKQTTAPILKNNLKNKFKLDVVDTRSKISIKNTDYESLSYTPDEYINSVHYAGSVLSKPDRDGIIRKIEPVFLYKGNYYPSLSLAVYSKLTGHYSFKIDNTGIYDVAGSLTIPIDTAQGTYTWLKWHKPISNDQLFAHKTYSAWTVLKSYEQLKNGKVPILNPELFRNKIVVIGATASALYDLKVTPMGADYPGVDIQATFIDNLVNGDFVHKEPHVISLIVLLVTVLLTLTVVLVLPPLQSSIITVLFMLVYFNYCLWSYSNNQAIDVITPHVFALFTVAIGYGLKFFSEGQKKEKIKNIMGKYLSEDVVYTIMKDMDNVEPGGVRAEITVLFSDIRNFTAISETLEPEEVSSILCEYFNEMVPLITKYNGTLNKFVGDAMLAIFNAPIKDENHPQNAVFCAVEMIDKVDELQKKWLEEGKPKIEIGIGINTGEAFIGSIGSKDRLEYTVIGDTVNVANRIESQNRLFGTRLLISKDTYERVKKLVDVIRISSVAIRGKAENIDIYEILSIHNNKHV